MPATRSPGTKQKQTIKVECKLCHILLANSGDLPRHMRIHDPELHLHPCPYASEGCTYRALQKSNLNTHIRKHLGEKIRCPYNDCKYENYEPGCVLRHKKKEHGYQTKRMAAKDTKASIIKRAQLQPHAVSPVKSEPFTSPALSSRESSLESSSAARPHSSYASANSSTSDLSIMAASADHEYPSFTDAHTSGRLPSIMGEFKLDTSHAGVFHHDPFSGYVHQTYMNNNYMAHPAVQPQRPYINDFDHMNPGAFPSFADYYPFSNGEPSFSENIFF
ncbi:hypothetical protein FA95DRAFT_1605739 [Auriscalpium vulgare]|uniref:Uncharacterized protein n=1 Tax=Auriscalpium vulgare TaxID=40419 RepID=A0ACB8RVG4_9AGAM|nr:hypothetical protein FA95DRAFT_1605739 [Auriscalpium vulgare]